MSELAVVTGLSGAGRSGAGDILEDLGWYVIDNLPPTLMPRVAELGSAPGSAVTRVALVVGAGPFQEEILPNLALLPDLVDRVRILFLDASTDVLVRRYEATRRRHPLAVDRSLADAIEAERHQLAAVKELADVVVDTSDLNLYGLRDRVRELFADEADEAMQVTLTSFGFKHGLPLDVDMVFDCRVLPNPHWEEELRHLTGRDPEVVTFLEAQELTAPFLDRCEELLALQLPAFDAEGKSYLTIAFGCTGGQHRSVAVAEEMARRLAARSLLAGGAAPRVEHRDIAR